MQFHYQENRCMLGTYFVILLTMFIIFIVGAVLGYSQSMDKLKVPMVKSMKKYEKNPETEDAKAVKSSWDQMQIDFKCCGVDDYKVGVH